MGSLHSSPAAQGTAPITVAGGATTNYYLIDSLSTQWCYTYFIPTETAHEKKMLSQNVQYIGTKFGGPLIEGRCEDLNLGYDSWRNRDREGEEAILCPQMTNPVRYR